MKPLSLHELRQAVADYIQSEGCSCCRDDEAHKRHKERLAKLLYVPPYADGSGYEFERFKTKENK